MADQVQRDVGGLMKLLDKPERGPPDDGVRREPFVDREADLQACAGGLDAQDLAVPAALSDDDIRSREIGDVRPALIGRRDVHGALDGGPGLWISQPRRPGRKASE